MIPKTLAEVAELAGQGESFDLCLRNFLDGFYAKPNAAAFSAEPPTLTSRIPQLGAIEDAYLAATAEWLAWRYDFTPPAWAFASSRFVLHRRVCLHSCVTAGCVAVGKSGAVPVPKICSSSENALSRA